jgi:hypothetical protein
MLRQAVPKSIEAVRSQHGRRAAGKARLPAAGGKVRHFLWLDFSAFRTFEVDQ